MKKINTIILYATLVLGGQPVLAALPGHGGNAAFDGIGSGETVKQTLVMAELHKLSQRLPLPGHGGNTAIDGIGSNKIEKATPESIQLYLDKQRKPLFGHGGNAALDGIGPVQ